MNSSRGSQSPRRHTAPDPDDDEGTISDGDSYLFGVLGTFEDGDNQSFLVEISDSDEECSTDPFKQMESRENKNKKPALDGTGQKSKRKVSKWFRKEFIEGSSAMSPSNMSPEQSMSGGFSEGDSFVSYSSYSTDWSDGDDAATMVMNAVNDMLRPF